MIDLKHVGMFLGATNSEKQFDLFIALSHLFFKTVRNCDQILILFVISLHSSYICTLFDTNSQHKIYIMHENSMKNFQHLMTHSFYKTGHVSGIV